MAAVWSVFLPEFHKRLGLYLCAHAMDFFPSPPDAEISYGPNVVTS